MWLIRTEMCYKYKVRTEFWKHKRCKNISISFTLFFEMIIFWHQNILKELAVHATSNFSSLFSPESTSITISTIQLSLSRSLITSKLPNPMIDLPTKGACLSCGCVPVLVSEKKPVNILPLLGKRKKKPFIFKITNSFFSYNVLYYHCWMMWLLSNNNYFL